MQLPAWSERELDAKLINHTFTQALRRIDIKVPNILKSTSEGQPWTTPKIPRSSKLTLFEMLCHSTDYLETSHCPP